MNQTIIKDTRKIRENIIKASFESKNGHIPTSFSIIEILVSVYNTMKHNPNCPNDINRDIFILSKGHAALGYYSVLSAFKYFSSEELLKFGIFKSRLGCHPDRLKVPGVEASCGSLGHGIGIAVGMALAFKIKQVNRKVYVLIGDGESNEGSVWEAVMIAVNQKLDNLVILYDNNQSQKRCLQIENPGKIFTSFGCKAFDVNGHDINEISQTIENGWNSSFNNYPKCIIANTIKGYGCKTLIDKVFEWHRRAPNVNEMKMLIKELYA